MTKDKFLRDLEKKLSMLSETERKETIDEYRDIIEEKVKHGKKESEAVKEFGSIDELAKEILSAYKIDPNYKKSEAGDKAKEIVDGAEELIKKGAKKISEVTDDVVDSIKKSDFDWTTSNIFEVIIKVIILLIFLAILKIPIYFASEIGSGIFGIGIEPFSSIFQIIWKVLIEVAYLGICVILIVKLITDYSNKTKSPVEEKKKHSSVASAENQKKSNVKKNNTFETIALAFAQLFVIFVLLLPLFFVAFLFLIAIIILIYLLCLKIGVYGFFIFAIGCFGFVCCLIDLIYRGFFSHKKIHLYPFIIHIILIIIGGVMSIAYLFNFEYHDYLPKKNYETKTDTYMEDIHQKAVINAHQSNIIIDNHLKDNQMKLEVTYYPKFATIQRHEDIDDNIKYITFVAHDKEDTFSFNNKYMKMLIADVRNKEIYNYSLFAQENVKIYVNEHTKDLVEN